MTERDGEDPSRRDDPIQSSSMEEGNASHTSWFRLGLGWCIGVLVSLSHATLRVERRGREAVDALRSRGEGYAYGFWHGRQWVLLGAHRGERCAIMVSMSRDGDLQEQVCLRFGYRVMRGSTSRGGRRALRELSRAVTEGWNPAIALDGPRGPKEKAQAGLVALARHHHLWVVPLAAASRRRRILGSWDGAEIPMPFTSAVVVYGEPFRVEDLSSGTGPGATARGTEELQRRLDEATVEAEKWRQR